MNFWNGFMKAFYVNTWDLNCPDNGFFNDIVEKRRRNLFEMN